MKVFVLIFYICSTQENDQQFSNGSFQKGELKSLQDSLSAFFTPSSVRRSRFASISGNTENCSGFRTKKEYSVDNDSHISKPTDKVGFINLHRFFFGDFIDVYP